MTIHHDELASLRHTTGAIALPPVSSGAKRFPPNTIYGKSVKPVLDIAFVVLASPIILTLVVLSGLLVALDGHNPFYTQQRVGRGGRVFRMFKLRTMVPNADALLEEYLSQNAEARAEWDKDQKLKNDPRITWIGRFLRRSSLDELPQFLNVLRGEMSIVGPRPYTVEQRALYAGVYYDVLRPGVTGLWQVSSRNDSDFQGRARYDDCYATSLSFGCDFRIMFKTITAVLYQTGR